MTRQLRSAFCAVAVTTLVGGLAAGTSATAYATTTSGSSAHSSSSSRTLAPNTRFFVPPAPAAARQQEASLLRQGKSAQAGALGRMLGTPQAVWFTSGTPARVERQVGETMNKAEAKGTVPVLVAYDIPGRDCAHDRRLSGRQRTREE